MMNSFWLDVLGWLLVLVGGLSRDGTGIGEARTAKNWGRGCLRKVSRDNRNLLIPQRILSAAFTGVAGRSALPFLPDGTELRKRAWSAPLVLPELRCQRSSQEQFPLALTNFKNLSEKHSPPGDEAPAMLNQRDTMDRPMNRNLAKSRGLTDSCAEPYLLCLLSGGRVLW